MRNLVVWETQYDWLKLQILLIDFGAHSQAGYDLEVIELSKLSLDMWASREVLYVED